MPNCRHCGASFRPSRSGRTVHCQAHRDPASRQAVAVDTRTACLACDGTGTDWIDAAYTADGVRKEWACVHCGGSGKRATSR
jgi:hypothetical protein